MTTWGPHGKFTCQPGYHYTIATQPSGPNRLEFEIGCAKMDDAHHCSSYQNNDQHTLSNDLRHIWYHKKLVDSGWPASEHGPPQVGDTYVTTNDFFQHYSITSQFRDDDETIDTTVCVNDANHRLKWDKDKRLTGSAEYTSDFSDGLFYGKKFWIVKSGQFKDYLLDTGSAAAVTLDRTNPYPTPAPSCKSDPLPSAKKHLGMSLLRF